MLLGFVRGLGHTALLAASLSSDGNPAYVAVPNPSKRTNSTNRHRASNSGSTNTYNLLHGSVSSSNSGSTSSSTSSSKNSKVRPRRESLFVKWGLAHQVLASSHQGDVAQKIFEDKINRVINEQKRQRAENAEMCKYYTNTGKKCPVFVENQKLLDKAFDDKQRSMSLFERMGQKVADSFKKRAEILLNNAVTKMGMTSFKETAKNLLNDALRKIE